MSRWLGDQRRQALLHKLFDLCGRGQAESESEDSSAFLKNFLPIRAHFRVLDPDVRLIIGDRGSGKTHLFRALQYDAGRSAMVQLAKERNQSALDIRKTKWLVGYDDAEKTFPPGEIVTQFADGKTPADLRMFWLGLLLRVLVENELIRKPAIPDSLVAAVLCKEWDLNKLVQQIDENLAPLYSALDSLDETLRAKGDFAFVSYDYLDRMTSGEWESLETVLEGLVHFWAYMRRLRNIRPKIFLRRDLYRKVTQSGPDIAKIAANRAELIWSIPEFYGVLFKRLLNDRLFFEYLKPAASKQMNLPLRTIKCDELVFSSHADLGRIPQVSEEEGYKLVVNRMFGEFMGKDPRRGRTLTWMPNHLKDGFGRIYPRSLLRLVEEAAEFEVRDRKAQNTNNLIHYTALRGALDKVSEYRVNELAEEEFPWIRTVRESFKGKGLLVPGDQKRFLGVLQGIKWSGERNLPPETRPGHLLNYLVDLGIFSYRSDNRVDVGDLYLEGFHLRRKGGVARPRRPAAVR